jgi:hypothetical protein
LGAKLKVEEPHGDWWTRGIEHNIYRNHDLKVPDLNRGIVKATPTVEKYLEVPGRPEAINELLFSFGHGDIQREGIFTPKWILIGHGFLPC